MVTIKIACVDDRLCTICTVFPIQIFVSEEGREGPDIWRMQCPRAGKVKNGLDEGIGAPGPESDTIFWASQGHRGDLHRATKHHALMHTRYEGDSHPLYLPH